MYIVYSGKNPHFFQRIDFIATPLSLTAERSKVVHFLTSFMDDRVGILMSRSVVKSGAFLMTRPFSFVVWILILVSFLIAASVAHLFRRFSSVTKERTDQSFDPRTDQTLSGNLYGYIQSFLFQGEFCCANQ